MSKDAKVLLIFYLIVLAIILFGDWYTGRADKVIQSVMETNK